MAKRKAPISFRNRPVDQGDFRSFMAEWSLRNAEENHVETIEEANDFEIFDEEEEDFLANLTVYEMHDMAEENLQKWKDSLPSEEMTESNETAVLAREEESTGNVSHDQSAQHEPDLSSPSLSEKGAQDARPRYRTYAQGAPAPDHPAPPQGT
jgi:hypothetical protein